MAAQLTTHTCPGGCGRDNIPDELFACGPCWHRLPRRLKTPILHTARMAVFDVADSEVPEHVLGGNRARRRTAVADARRWYAENPR